MKRKIRWNNIIFLILNIVGIIMLYLALKNIKMIDKIELTKYRLIIVVIVCYLEIVGSSFIIKNYNKKGGIK